MTRFFSLASALVCIGAGIYLLSLNAAAPNSILEAIAHGIGIYFIGKGIFSGASLWAQADLVDVWRQPGPDEPVE